MRPRLRHQPLRQLLGRGGGEEAGVGIGAGIDLGMHGGDHVRMAMAERRHGRAAAGVDIGFALAVVEVDAFAPDRHGRRLAQAAVKDAAHGNPLQKLSLDNNRTPPGFF